MRHPADISTADLARVTGGGILKPSTIKSLESAAVSFAQKRWRTSPVFPGDVTNSVAQKDIILHGPNRGVMVSTGDEANRQFLVGRAIMGKLGQFLHMKSL